MGNVDEKRYIQLNKEKDYGVGLNEYNGNYTIVMCRRGKVTDDIWMDWCQIKGQEAIIPQGVKLGSKENTIKILEKMLFWVENS